MFLTSWVYTSKHFYDYTYACIFTYYAIYFINYIQIYYYVHSEKERRCVFYLNHVYARFYECALRVLA